MRLLEQAGDGCVSLTRDFGEDEQPPYAILAEDNRCENLEFVTAMREWSQLVLESVDCEDCIKEGLCPRNPPNEFSPFKRREQKQSRDRWSNISLMMKRALDRVV